MLEKLYQFHAAKAHSVRSRKVIKVAVAHYVRLGFTEFSSVNLALYRDKRIEEGAAATTVRGELCKLRSFARWLGNEVDVVLPPEVQRVPVAWSRAQFAKLLKQASATDRVVFGIPGSIYWPALIGAAYDSGERVSALMGIHWSAIDFDERTMLVPAEVRKGAKRDKQHRLSVETINHLRHLATIVGGRKGQPVFNHGSQSTLWEAYGKLLNDAGLPSDRRRKFHCLRRTAASEVHRAGGDATEFLDHSSDAITRRHYLAPWAFRIRLPWRPRRWLRWLGL